MSEGRGNPRAGGRVSPCIGVCSTTYGDLVCRGCKRFAHEVVQWNGYDHEQRDAIWRRLEELREGAMRKSLSSERLHELCAAADTVRMADQGMSGATLAYEVLRRLVMRRMCLPWEGPEQASEARETLRRIDREFLDRSSAFYERSFRIPAE